MARYYDRADYEEEPEENLTFVQKIAKTAAQKARQVQAGATIDASKKAGKSIPIADRAKYEQEVRGPITKTTAEPKMVATGGSGVLPLPTINDDDKIPPEEIERRRKARQVTAVSLTDAMPAAPRQGAAATKELRKSTKQERYNKMMEERARKAAKNA